MTPGGDVPVEDLREGDDILSISFEGRPTTIRTRIARISRLRESVCVNVDDRCLVTPCHSYIVEDFMVCHNKKILSDRDLFA